MNSRSFGPAFKAAAFAGLAIGVLNPGAALASNPLPPAAASGFFRVAALGAQYQLFTSLPIPSSVGNPAPGGMFISVANDPLTGPTLTADASQAQAEVQLIWSYEVMGVSGATVPIDLDGAMKVIGGGYFDSGIAIGQIKGSASTQNNVYANGVGTHGDYVEDCVAGYDDCDNFYNTDGAFQVVLSVPTNTVETLEIQVAAQSNFSDSSEFFAMVDPTLGVDPSTPNAGSFSIIESDGIGNGPLSNPVPGGVPEPAAWALMIVGFGLAGARLRRTRHPAHRAAA